MNPSIKSRSGATEEINFAKILDQFRKRWYYVAISLILSIIASKMYLRYSQPIYQATATLRVNEDNMNQELGILEGFGMMRDNIQSEIQLIKSRTMVTAALNEMDFKTAYYLVGTLVTSEMYKDDSPFIVEYDTTSNVMYYKQFLFFYLGGSRYKLVYNNQSEQIESIHYFGEEVDFRGFRFTIYKRETKRYRLHPGIEYRWEAIKWKNLVGRAMGNLNVEQSGYLVPILQVSFLDPLPRFASDFLNTLVSVYQRKDTERKTQAANQAIDFIRSQVDTIKSSVSLAEDTLQRFREKGQLLDIPLNISMNMTRVTTYTETLLALNVKKDQIKSMISGIEKGDSAIGIPFNIDQQTDPQLASLLASYNSVQQERITALQSLTITHPRVQELSIKLQSLGESLRKNLESSISSIDKQIFDLENKILGIEGNLQQLPSKQRQLKGLMREYEVNEKILNTLLEKQAEAQIAKASIVSSIQILDPAILPVHPVSPIPEKVYILCAGLGICMGFLLILLMGMLKNTLSYKEEIESLSLTPVIGTVRRSSASLNHKYPRLVSVDNPKSSLSESIRSIRTNLQFVLSEDGPKVISITSSISGEGKSFITINLGGIISLLKKKVVILDLDLRKPKLHYSFGNDNSKGISTYLVGKSTLDEILNQTEYSHLSIITSGPIPPNPAELIQSDRMMQLIERLKEDFDYVLVDTPPIGIVTDGTLLLRNSDVALYVLRADFSKKSFARNPDQLSESHNIRNMYIIFNSVSASNRRYGSYGYKVYNSGYYSDDKKKEPWWKFWKWFKRD